MATEGCTLVHFAWLEGNIHSNHYNFISSKQLLFVGKNAQKAFDTEGDGQPW